MLALQDKIYMCRVLSNSISSYQPQISVKNCNDIRFSHGGHMFALVNNEKTIHVYNFYTYECTERMKFQGHIARITSIDWFPNDMGFTTAGQDGNIYFYDLFSDKEIGSRNTDYDCPHGKVKFTSVVNLPGKPYEFIAVGAEKVIETKT